MLRAYAFSFKLKQLSCDKYVPLLQIIQFHYVQKVSPVFVSNTLTDFHMNVIYCTAVTKLHSHPSRRVLERCDWCQRCVAMDSLAEMFPMHASIVSKHTEVLFRQQRPARIWHQSNQSRPRCGAFEWSLLTTAQLQWEKKRLWHEWPMTGEAEQRQACALVAKHSHNECRVHYSCLWAAVTGRKQLLPKQTILMRHPSFLRHSPVVLIFYRRSRASIFHAGSCWPLRRDFILLLILFSTNADLQKTRCGSSARKVSGW